MATLTMTPQLAAYVAADPEALADLPAEDRDAVIDAASAVLFDAACQNYLEALAKTRSYLDWTGEDS